MQLVFGELPRVPAELLSEGPSGLIPLNNALHDPAGLDEVGVEFRKRLQIRDRARQAAMEQTSKEEAVRKALKAAPNPTRVWNSGQWVYVHRRGKPGDSLHPTSRWVGWAGIGPADRPGHCFVRNANETLALLIGAVEAGFPLRSTSETLACNPLLRQVMSGAQAQAVDVMKEGPPPNDHDGLDDAPAAWRATVVRFLVEQLGFVRNLVEPCWYMEVCSGQRQRGSSPGGSGRFHRVGQAQCQGPDPGRLHEEVHLWQVGRRRGRVRRKKDQGGGKSGRHRPVQVHRGADPAHPAGQGVPSAERRGAHRGRI